MSSNLDNVQKQFIEGTHTVFTSLFNDGLTSGVDLLILKDIDINSVYQESKYKEFKDPIKLVCKATLTPSLEDDSDVANYKNSATFRVPLKSLMDNDIRYDTEGLENLRRFAYMKFQKRYYKVENVKPATYIADVFLFYDFICSECVEGDLP